MRRLLLDWDGERGKLGPVQVAEVVKAGVAWRWRAWAPRPEGPECRGTALTRRAAKDDAEVWLGRLRRHENYGGPKPPEPDPFANDFDPLDRHRVTADDVERDIRQYGFEGGAR